MKTLTKTLVAATALAISVSVFSHMNEGRSGQGFMHPMMNADSPQYQAMLELRENPEAMQAWMQSMHDSPQAMIDWMKQVHGENVDNWEMGFGCHGNRFNNEQPSTTE